MRCPFIQAGPFWRTTLWLLGGTAITMPWMKAYFLPDVFADRQVRRHELAHLRQLKSEGPFWFSVNYLRLLVRFGYFWHPYELAARVRASEDALTAHQADHPAVQHALKITKVAR